MGTNKILMLCLLVPLILGGCIRNDAGEERLTKIGTFQQGLTWYDLLQDEQGSCYKQSLGGNREVISAPCKE